MTKKVTYEGKEYKITFQSYGYGDSRFCINGEATSFYMCNENLSDVESFKSYAKKAIEEYIAKKVAEENFKNWDGTI